MTRQRITVDLDDGLLAQARAVLRTASDRDTIEAALREVVALDARRQVIAHALANPFDADALREEAWRR